MPNVDGVSPDTPIETLECGGTRSKSPYAFEQLPPRAMFRLARRFQYGNEHGHEVGNWLKLPMNSFISHGLQHVFAFMLRDTSEGDPVVHLEAAMWNFTCAVEVYLIRKENSTMAVENVTVTPHDVAIHDLRILIQANSERGKAFTSDNWALKSALEALEQAKYR